MEGVSVARPRKDQAPDLAQPQDLTAGMIERLRCPDGKAQAFLRDVKTPSLRVRVTASGAKSYVFEAKLNRQTIRRTIGDARAWGIDEARAEANRLRVILDGGDDPRELDRQQATERAARAAAASVAEATVGTAWTAYLAERKPHWGDRHYLDHLTLAQAGGKPARRGTDGRGVTIPGPIHPLLSMRLADLKPDVIEAWAAKEAKTRPTYGRLAWRCLKAFLNWCAEQDDYKAIVPVNPAKTKKARQAFGKPTAKSDVLLREQLAAWFQAVRSIGNPAIGAYLQILLLTGARPGEVLDMRWSDLNEQWRGLTMRDKVEGERIIPLTPYVHALLSALPRRKAWVFYSPSSKTGRIALPRNHHVAACATAAIGGLTLHGLRRSFKSLTEWLDIPAGVVAQIMGHKPSATAEKHYTVRPLDLLRVHHERIEAWILEQAGVPFAPNAAGKKLRVVAK